MSSIMSSCQPIRTRPSTISTATNPISSSSPSTTWKKPNATTWVSTAGARCEKQALRQRCLALGCCPLNWRVRRQAVFELRIPPVWPDLYSLLLGKMTTPMTSARSSTSASAPTTYVLKAGRGGLRPAGQHDDEQATGAVRSGRTTLETAAATQRADVRMSEFGDSASALADGVSAVSPLERCGLFRGDGERHAFDHPSQRRSQQPAQCRDPRWANDAKQLRKRAACGYDGYKRRPRGKVHRAVIRWGNSLR